MISYFRGGNLIKTEIQRFKVIIEYCDNSILNNKSKDYGSTKNSF